MNYFEFKTMIDMRDMTPTEKVLMDVLRQMQHQTNTIGELIKIVREQGKMIAEQQEKTRAIDTTICKIAPDLDVIEMIAEDEGQERDMIDHYMNRNPNWVYDSNFIPKDIITEMSQGNAETERELLAWYEDNGASYITQLYKKWKGIDPEQNLLDNLEIGKNDGNH